MSNPNFPHGLDISASSSTLVDSHPSKADVYSDAGQRDAIARYGIAGRVWEASYLLALYIDPHPNDTFDPPCPAHLPIVLELGSGSGYVARRLSSSGRCGRLVCTDLPDVLELLRSNLDGADVQVRALPWGDVDAAAREGEGVTHIVCCDLVYFPELLAPLLRTLLALTSSTAAPNAQLIIAYKMRSLTKEAPFWAAFGMWFSFTRVSHSLDTGADDVFIFLANRKPHTLDWMVPQTDAALLQGVGLPSTDGADAFEVMLFMTMDATEL
ncbi:hypothetical protein EXIGLDRAFT_766888 [Exidia glandulosa HHB12029]|uniref:Peptidase A2 domain-containing protein n=1 Tax=Exidia glandulosa HHB12029 TaxID=1314781 RepID=A0A165JEH9_EXIGL|nr:hypothetical protein EXIGLDRAFT_766888 [Exidia glandulosa HHB12029]